MPSPFPLFVFFINLTGENGVPSFLVRGCYLFSPEYRWIAFMQILQIFVAVTFATYVKESCKFGVENWEVIDLNS